MKMRLKGILVSTLAALAVAGPALAGEYDLVIEEKTVNVTGRERPAMTVNGSIPGPVLRMREGAVWKRVRSGACIARRHSACSPSDGARRVGGLARRVKAE